MRRHAPSQHTHTHQSGLCDPLLTSRLGERGEERDISKDYQTSFRPTAPLPWLHFKMIPTKVSTSYVNDGKPILVGGGAAGGILAMKSEIHSVVLDSLQPHEL